jgi:hypothetical protein
MLPSAVPVPASDADGPGAELRELLTEHARISAWLDRLDTLGADTPSAVSSQVRADYLRRLGVVTATVAEHANGLREIVRMATKRIALARDQLPELRLRHAVGELDDAALAQRLAVLRREATEAEQERGTLAGLLEQADGAVAAAAARMPGGELPPDAGRVPAQPEIDDAFGEWQAPVGSGPTRADAKTVEGSGETADEDELGFLDTLPQSRPPAAVPAAQPAPRAPAAAKLMCKSCRYANDATAWYCEKCGSELG